MKLGFDFDGVISDCGKLKSDGARKIYGIDVPPEEFKKEIVVGKGLLTPEQYRSLQKAVYGTREVGFLMEPVDGVIHYVQKLFAEGHDIQIVTSRTGTELEIAKEWALDQGLGLHFVGVGYGKSKAEAARGLDLYIDDDLDKLEPLVGIVPHRFLFSWGYNRYADVGEVAERVASWEEIYNIVNHLQGRL